MQTANTGECYHGRHTAGANVRREEGNNPPVLGLASDGKDVFMSCGGGGAKAAKEVPNVVQAHRYDESTGGMSTIASLDTEKCVVVFLSYGKALDVWLGSVSGGSRAFQLSVESNSITQLCEWTTETEGKGPSQNVVRLSPSGHLVATGGTDGRVKIYEAGKLQCEPVLQHELAKNDEVLDLSFSSDNKTLASCDRTGSCRLWDTANGEQTRVIDYKFSGAAVSVRVLRYLPPQDGQQLLLCAMSAPRGPACIAIYNNDGQVVKEAKLDQKPLTAMELDDAAQHVCVNFVTGGKRIYSIPAMKCLKKLEDVHELPAPCAAFVGSTAISGSGDRSINLLVCKKGSSSSGGSSCLYLLLLVLIMMVVGFLLLRIGMKGTMLSGEL